MFTQTPKTTNNHHDISEKRDKTRTAEQSPSQKGLLPGFLQNQESIMQLQKTIGNRAVMQLLKSHFQQQPAGPPIQMMESEENEINNTGMPDDLKAGLESLSGFDLSDVRVHRNSDKPSNVGALAYTQGTNIYIGPGQEQHLRHEAWHAVQQKQGRVQATTQAAGLPVNDDPELEKEADEMGVKAGEVGSERIQLIPDREQAQQADVLQAMMNQHTPRVQVRSKPAAPSGAVPVTQLLLVRVRTTSQGMGPRIISELKIEGRAPTTAKKGQGDHTVAEALMVLALTNFIEGKSHAELADTLIKLLAQLDDQAKTRFKNEDDKIVKLDIESIKQSISEYKKMVTNPFVQGEDLNKKLEDIVEGFIRLWNKRAGAAYMRSSGKTTGGGEGVDEKEAKKQIMEIGEEAKESGSTDDLAMDMANHVVTMIDFVIKDPKKDLAEAAQHIAEAIELAITAYPDIEYNYYDLMVKAVDVYAERTKMDKKQHETLFDLVHSKVTPYTEDDYTDFEEDEEMKEKDKEKKEDEDMK